MITTYISMMASMVFNYTSQWLPMSSVLPPPIVPNTTEALDYLCMCRSFGTPKTHLSDRLNHTQCTSLNFDSRWSIDTNMSHLPSSVLPIFVDGKELVLGGTLRAIVFVKNQSNVVIAFRHQEGESLFDNEMWEAMGLFGRNFVQLNAPSILTYGSFLDYVCRSLQYLIFGTRHFWNADFYPLAKEFAEEMKTKYPDKTFYFTGYSMGGAIAQLLALDLQTNATTFAANGYLDIMNLYKIKPGPNFLPSQLVNYIHKVDDVPKLDCHIGSLVIDTSPQKNTDPELVHYDFVYGNTAWNLLQHSNISSTSGRLYSQDFGFCLDNAQLNGPQERSVWDILFYILCTHFFTSAALGALVYLIICWSRL
ncbi:hypothetical protein THRCLA_02542 [Thraustotheca clavata]|uniref:Thioesterase domain-containing protein n=1 Tax=Thraustotheca clavata TaxID=74557 RepID=A0A1W0A4W8_9STRA|nr:hypothetical protein THRCLA_02542 [Thraustotheca clavata]